MTMQPGQSSFRERLGGIAGGGRSGPPPALPALVVEEPSGGAGEPSAPVFQGYAAGALATVIPNQFFADLLPHIESRAELLVTMYLFYALGRRRGVPRTISALELAAELPLRRALVYLPGNVEDNLREGLRLATQRGTVLRALARRTNGREPLEVYMVNSEAARAAMRSGALPGLEVAPEPEPLPQQSAPTIFELYEENIGTVAPLIADDLREVEATYPYVWIESAFKEAVLQNKRNWRYVLRILERWRAEGRTNATPGRDLQPNNRGRDLEGRYRNVVRR